MSSKLHKETVAYTPRTQNWVERCAVCGHWDGNGVCAIVQGPIAYSGWCNQWKPRPKAPQHVSRPLVRSGGNVA